VLGSHTSRWGSPGHLRTAHQAPTSLEQPVNWHQPNTGERRRRTPSGLLLLVSKPMTRTRAAEKQNTRYTMCVLA
jgi:hypothetical protein